MEWRNRRFDTGKTPVRSFPVPVISVGNLSVGGTGKTPMCIMLLSMLQQAGHTPALLSRGYGRKTKGFYAVEGDSTAREVGDEPLEIFHSFNGKVPVFVCEDRCVGAERLLEASPSVDCIVLDDAYQHRFIHRDVNILLTDYHRLYTRDEVLPSGRLRERPSGATRADVVVVTKCPSDLSADEASAITSELHLAPHQHLFFATISYSNNCPPSQDNYTSSNSQPEECSPSQYNCTLPITHCTLKTSCLFTGIAHPEPLIEHCKASYPDLQTLRFPDHHAYTQADIQRIAEAASHCDIVITTNKDFHRLPESFPMEVRQKLFVQKIHPTILFNQQSQFENIIVNANRNIHSR